MWSNAFTKLKFTKLRLMRFARVKDPDQYDNI